MVLLRQLPGGERIEHCHFLRQHLRHYETFGHQHVIANHEQVGYNHRHRSEKLFQIVRKFRTSLVTGIHRHEITYRTSQLDISTKKIDSFRKRVKTVLNDLDLCLNDRQHFRIDPIELIEAAPKTCFRQSRKDAPHGFVIQTFPAICDNTANGK